MSEFHLTKILPPYIFAQIDQLKQEARNRGLDIIDYGMGNPDLAPPQHVINELSELSKDPSLYGYSVSGGMERLKKANCDYYLKRFNVELDPKKESLVTIGAKEGLTSLATAISDHSNYIAVPNPSYPIHTFAFIIAKSRTVGIDNNSPEQFFQNFKKHVETSIDKPTAVIVNFPCNPTTQIATLDFYQTLVDYCIRHQIYIISDIAYCEIYFGKENRPHSILEIPKAKEIAIEFSSVSKSYSMAGCRVGFAAGNEKLISALAKIKSYLDYGSFMPLQLVSSSAMSDKSDKYLEDTRATYFKRAQFLVKTLKSELNWEADLPKATMFIWAKIPSKFKLSSFEFCNNLLKECGVALSPGSSFGSNGEGYVRFSLIHGEEKTIETAKRMKVFFDKN
jgi:alanine-synthesizing transaminase